MTTARTAILARVRQAERTALLPALPIGGSSSPLQDPPRDGDTLARFVRELKLLGVDVHQVNSSLEAQDAVRHIVGEQRVLSWDPSALPHDVFSVLPAPMTGSTPREQQSAADIGVTACDAAVAETGSLVLLSGPGRSRAVSLLPPIHLAIVRLGDLAPTLSDAFVRLQERMRSVASCTVITGPSRTADIELTLTLGIHGPGRVVVLIAP